MVHFKDVNTSFKQSSSPSLRWSERIPTATTPRARPAPSSSTLHLSCRFLRLHTPFPPLPQQESREVEQFPLQHRLTCPTALRTAGLATTVLRGRMASTSHSATRASRSSSAAEITMVGAFSLYQSLVSVLSLQRDVVMATSLC